MQLKQWNTGPPRSVCNTHTQTSFNLKFSHTHRNTHTHTCTHTLTYVLREEKLKLKTYGGQMSVFMVKRWKNVWGATVQWATVLYQNILRHTFIFSFINLKWPPPLCLGLYYCCGGQEAEWGGWRQQQQQQKKKKKVTDSRSGTGSGTFQQWEQNLHLQLGDCSSWLVKRKEKDNDFLLLCRIFCRRYWVLLYRLKQSRAFSSGDSDRFVPV